MIIERAQATRWRRSFCIAIECSGEDGDFYRERSKKTGKLGNPKLPRKNEAVKFTRSGRGTLAPAQAHFRDGLRALIKLHHLPVCLLPMRLTVIQTYGRKKEIGGRVFSGMDASATLEAVCDAIQQAAGFGGLVADDAQIVDRRAVGHYVKGRYALRIELEAMPHWGE